MSYWQTSLEGRHTRGGGISRRVLVGIAAVLVLAAVTISASPYVRFLRMNNSRDLDEWKQKVIARERGVMTEISVYSRGDKVRLYISSKWAPLPVAEKKRLLDGIGREYASMRQRYGLERNDFEVIQPAPPWASSDPDETKVAELKTMRVFSWKTKR